MRASLVLEHQTLGVPHSKMATECATQSATIRGVAWIKETAVTAVPVVCRQWETGCVMPSVTLVVATWMGAIVAFVILTRNVSIAWSGTEFVTGNVLMLTVTSMAVTATTVIHTKDAVRNLLAMDTAIWHVTLPSVVMTTATAMKFAKYLSWVFAETI
jgi:hypothetical protein